MNDKEWAQLFNLIEKAINLPNLTASEKGERIRDEAISRDQEGNLDEFVTEVADLN